MTHRRNVLTAAGLATAGVLAVSAPAAAHGSADPHGADADRQRRRSIRTANLFYRALEARDIDAFAALRTVDAFLDTFGSTGS